MAIMQKCKLTIKDQCNVKFDGLDAVLRKRLIAKLKYVDPTARFSHAFQLKRWDGKIAFFSMGGGTYYNMLPYILTDILDAGYEVDIDDQRPETDWEFPVINEEVLADMGICWPEGHVMAGDPIMLREHQVRAINGYLENYQSMGKIATGAGKTIITAVLSLLVGEVTGGRSIIIVPSKSLVVQTEADFKNIGLDVGVFFGDRKELNRQHTICTWQSLAVLNKKGSTRKKKNGKFVTEATFDETFDINSFLKDVNCVIVDECFDGRTPILTPMGYCPIQDLKPHDIIVNYSETEKVFKEDEIVSIHKNLSASSNEDMLELEMDIGIVIRVTANHKFLTTDGWVRADCLTENHNIINTLTGTRCENKENEKNV
jgi:hypothetical protein